MDTGFKVLLGLAGAGAIYYVWSMSNTGSTAATATAAPAAPVAAPATTTTGASTATPWGFKQGVPNFLQAPTNGLRYTTEGQYGNAYAPNGLYSELTAPYLWLNNPADYPFWATVAFAAIAANNGNQAFINRPRPLPCAGCPAEDTNVDAINWAIENGWMPVPAYAPSNPNNTITVASVTNAATQAALAKQAASTTATTAAPTSATLSFTGDERMWQAFR